MTQHNLAQLLDYFAIPAEQLHSDLLGLLNKQPLLPASILVNDLKLNSQLVMSNDVFIALKGVNSDGRDYILQAIQAGAIAIIADSDEPHNDRTITRLEQNNKHIIQINVYQLAQQLSALANYFYQQPSEHLCVVAITGTNGKTTISQLIAQWVTLLGHKSATIGTLGNGIYNQLSETQNTTPSALDVATLLAGFVQQHVQLVAMEVSSHGLALGRVKAINFATAVFTNLSRDHLDFHQTMANYEQAKWSLFSTNASELAVKQVGKKVINYDDQTGQKWLKQLPDCLIVSSQPESLSVLTALGHQYICATNVTYHDRGATIVITSTWGSAQIESSLFGAFNVANLLMALATLLSLNYAFNDLMAVAAQLTPICGRMEIFSHLDKPTIIVDYAHTPDALEKALTAARIHCQKRLWVIFGCGGDRDAGKRPLMAKVAQTYADAIIVTNDNPRTEDPLTIINDILTGFQSTTEVQVVTDRAQALASAIQQAQSGDIILVAGKGHEDYQIIGKKKLHYSDRETATQLLGDA